MWVGERQERETGKGKRKFVTVRNRAKVFLVALTARLEQAQKQRFLWFIVYFTKYRGWDVHRMADGVLYKPTKVVEQENIPTPTKAAMVRKSLIFLHFLWFFLWYAGWIVLSRPLCLFDVMIGIWPLPLHKTLWFPSCPRILASFSYDCHCFV